MENIISFEYYVIKLHEWYKEVYPDKQENDLSTLKILKLLFFGVAIQSNEEDPLIETTFSNFCAMPYGHVESKVYDFIKTKEPFIFIELHSRSSSIKDNEIPDSSLNEDGKQKISNSIQLLKQQNFDLIKMSASDLVELSHEWYSWKYFFNKAKINGTNSELIPIEIIKNEHKFFNL